MNEKYVSQLVEELENTCFPIQINWNNEKLYVKGLIDALDSLGLELVEKE